MPSVRYVILQPTPFCNIACQYCYLSDRSRTARMKLETLDRIFSDLFSSGWVGDELDVVWHAGEPLVIPVRYYERAFSVIAGLTPPDTKVRHSFQTNGTLIDDRWCAFFKDHDAAVGVSIDGPRDIHDARRVTRSGQGTFDKVLAGIRCLRKNKVDFGIIAVLSSASLGRARELHEFFYTEGVTSISFNIESVEGVNTITSWQTEDDWRATDAFLREFWNLNVRTNGIYHWREFHDMLSWILRSSDDVATGNILTRPFGYLNFDYQGNYCTFSPEFLGQKSLQYKDFIIGNVWKHPLAQSVESDVFKRLSRDVAEGVERCRASCEYFAVCGGGSPVNKLYENGSVTSTETKYCLFHTKLVANIAMEIAEASTEGDCFEEAG